MIKRHTGLFLWGILSLVAVPAQAGELPVEMLQLVNDATFEVVVLKSKDDPLSYEKELPMHLLPYRQRTDKYLSIGSAFAIGDGKFISAEHVISLTGETQLTNFYLRDREGKVYELDKIHQYSTRRDFIVFDLKTKVTGRHYQMNREPTVNSRVFAVGNAHGEGVIVRDGLLTSRTDEQVDGKWKWIRFSAAASPGNSGGPLLDEQGREPADPTPADPDATLDLGRLREAFARLAEELAPQQRAAFVLREIEGLETAEVARIMNVAPSTVRNHLLQARRRLRVGLERDYPGLVPSSARDGVDDD